MKTEKLNTLRAFMQNTYDDAKNVEPSIARSIMSDMKYLDGMIEEIANRANTIDELALPIQNVSQQRGLLVAFANFIQSDTAHLNYDFTDLVEIFLATNCG